MIFPFGSAKKLTVDALGCALAAWTAPGVAEAAGLAADWGGRPDATIWFAGSKVPGPNAAFANSTLVHALDYDDVYPPGTLHITSIVVPTMLAAAETSGASGRDALAAMVMGIEIAGRIGMAEHGKRRGQGFLPSSLVGGFGAVVTAARLFGLREGPCVDAMGIHYAQASGNRQALLDATLTKRIQPAFAARSAMWAVALAERGVTGAHRALDGAAGDLGVYVNGPPPEPDELLATRNAFEIERVAIKHYPSCGACHNAQIAAERLVAEAGVKGDDVDRVELFGFGSGNIVAQPFCIGPNPQVTAQFSVAWAVAHTLLRGPTRLRHFTDENVSADRDVAKLAEQITYTGVPDDAAPPPAQPDDYPAYATMPQGVIVYTKDGRRLVGTQYPADTFPPGGPSFDAVVEKFHDSVAFSGACDADRAATIVDAIRGLDAAEDVSRLVSLVSAPAR
jgi:2-methylcitrate dehydratase PrpD